MFAPIHGPSSLINNPVSAGLFCWMGTGGRTAGLLDQTEIL